MSRLIYAIGFLILIITILLGFLIWWPKLQEFSILRDKLSFKDAEIEQKKEYFKNLSSISNKLTNYSEELVKIDSAFPVDPSVPELFNFIEVTSSENGLILETLTAGEFSQNTENQEINEISFNLVVLGSYSAFKNFLSAIYANTRMIDIESINFSAPEDEDLFSFNLNLNTYSHSGTREIKSDIEEIE
ncbi:MAG: type 4a pilus biogenesis protein PilO [Candidatus Nealsonbacteria bacterium]